MIEGGVQHPVPKQCEGHAWGYFSNATTSQIIPHKEACQEHAEAKCLHCGKAFCREHIAEHLKQHEPKRKDGETKCPSGGTPP